MVLKDKNETTSSPPARTTSRQEGSKSYDDFARNFRLSRLIDPSEPWVLVDEGSFLGYFDWVPRHFRVGPWSIAAQFYLTAIFAMTLFLLVYFLSDASHPWWTTNLEELEYPSRFSWGWTYNLAASIWMSIVTYQVLVGPISYRAWFTYTVQSWTLLWIRHVLCTLAPLAKWALLWAEYIRFPVACSTTATFVIWNGLIFPYAYFFAMKTPQEKTNFYNFFFSFRLVQLHFFNMLFCTLNILYTSPRRRLEYIDFAFSIFSLMIYMAWYLLVLDRLGVHLYFVFSPRVWYTVIPSWTLVLATYLGAFMFWRAALNPAGSG